MYPMMAKEQQGERERAARREMEQLGKFPSLDRPTWKRAPKARRDSGSLGRW